MGSTQDTDVEPEYEIGVVVKTNTAEVEEI